MKMNRRILPLMMLGWVLWFTQEESHPRLHMPTHWSVIGQFSTESACNAYGQKLIDQLGSVLPQKGYTRATAVMSMHDTRRGGQGNRIQHEVQTTLYCIPDDIDPQLSIKK
jgi:hypothetical protein